MCKADNLPPYCAVVKNSRSLNFLDPSGPAWPVTGELYLYLYSLFYLDVVVCVDIILPFPYKTACVTALPLTKLQNDGATNHSYKIITHSIRGTKFSRNLGDTLNFPGAKTMT